MGKTVKKERCKNKVILLRLFFLKKAKILKDFLFGIGIGIWIWAVESLRSSHHVSVVRASACTFSRQRINCKTTQRGLPT